MTGKEFRGMREKAGLSVRVAAEHLEVAPSTIQRWQADTAVIPERIAERMFALAAGMPLTVSAERTIGRLFAVLEKAYGQDVPQSIMSLAQGKPSAAVGQLIQIVRRANPDNYAIHEPEIETLMNQIGVFPPFLAAAEHAEFYLGYYQRRAERHLSGTLADSHSGTEAVD